MKFSSNSVEVENSTEAVYELFLSNNWGDGLPIIPPTEEAVSQMLSGTKRSPGEVVALVAPSWAEATIEKIAINAVMAGCRAEYLPIIITAVEAACEEKLNLYAIQTTTHPASILLIVNGPIRNELNINSKSGVFGPGWRSNATIGRAIRLVLMNIGGALPGINDMSTQGQPCKYTFCIAENEEDSPWMPLHLEKGFNASDSTVTVVPAENPHNINDHCATNGEELLNTLVYTLPTMGNNDILLQHGEPIIALGVEHANTLFDSGYSKNDIRSYIYNNARLPRRSFIDNAIKRYYSDFSDDSLIPIASEEDITIIVTGGAGKHSSFLPTFGRCHSVTRLIK
ncbi:hypothetical protein ACFLWF_00145 [Chloroflexota bacterium]